MSNESLDEKLRMKEQIKSYDTKLKSYNDDIQTLLSRIEDVENENKALRTHQDQKLSEEKKKLLHEVEEIRKREEKLENELAVKLEQELYRM